MSSARHGRRALLVLGAALLSGCGFALRRAPDFAFRSLFLDIPASSPIVIPLQRQLQAVGGLTVLTDAGRRKEAEVVLSSTGERHVRTVVNMTSAGQVREIELKLLLDFTAQARDGRMLIEDGHIERRMSQSYSETQALAEAQETEMLYASMRDDVVQQLMRRLASLQP